MQTLAPLKEVERMCGTDLLVPKLSVWGKISFLHNKDLKTDSNQTNRQLTVQPTEYNK